ncbi:MAG: hypothetical protein HKN18_03810 [Silicimonas sp.]|nr:hypothetical protein [Silicimonas sp.]
MIRLWDSFLSGLCALITAGAIGVPIWGAFRAVQADLIPAWTWVAMVFLGFVGLVMVGAFLRKAGRGVHPLRERRR